MMALFTTLAKQVKESKPSSISKKDRLEEEIKTFESLSMDSDTEEDNKHLRALFKEFSEDGEISEAILDAE